MSLRHGTEYISCQNHVSARAFVPFSLKTQPPLLNKTGKSRFLSRDRGNAGSTGFGASRAEIEATRFHII